MIKKQIIIAAVFLAGACFVQAGNKDRAGQAGGTQLLINPWARSSGWAGANSASAHGLEAVYLNVAGTAFARGTEVIFSRTNWLGGTGIGINSFGFTQQLSKDSSSSSVLGVGLMSISFGDILITTPDVPEGGLGNFSPHFNNMTIFYSKSFSSSIYGGAALKLISEGIADVRAKGAALDAGIQYVAGSKNNLKFGIAIKNVGMGKMKYSGDGLSLQGTPPNKSYQMTIEQRSAGFELPSLVNIGLAYDLYFSSDSVMKNIHRLTIAGNFTANSFSKDQYNFGVEYGLKSFLMLRAGMSMEKGIFNSTDRTTALTGPTGGFSVELPFGKNKRSTFAVDYSYRATNPFQGVHSVGVRVNL